MKLSSKTKSNLLLYFAGIVVAYLRTFIESHRTPRHTTLLYLIEYFFKSIVEFFVMGVAYYFALILVIGVSYVFFQVSEKRFLDDGKRSGLTFDEAIVYAAFIVLVSAILIFLLAHWEPTDIPRE